MEFRRYYGQLAQKQKTSVPHADEAKRDYYNALILTVDAGLFAR